MDFTDIIEMAESIMGGSTACIIYLVLSYTLDIFITPSISNLISLIIGSIVNFIIQTKH